MVPTVKEIEAAKDWLLKQRAVVHPGPIETIDFALNVLWAQARDREENQQTV